MNVHSAGDVSHPAYILLAFLFVFLNAFFVAAEFALVKIRITRLEVLAKSGNRLAKMAQNMVDHLDPYLSATQFGITLASLGLGWIGEPAFARLITRFLNDLNVTMDEKAIHSLAITLGFTIISALHIILGELVPKSIAIQTAEKICMVVAVPLKIFYIIFYPFLWFLNSFSNFILKIMGFKTATENVEALSEAELKLVLEDSVEEGSISQTKKTLLDKAIDFSHKTVSEIMIPRDQVVCFYLQNSLEENLLVARDSGHTRIPLVDKTTDKALGFIHVKDIIWSLQHGDVINLFDLRRPLILFDGSMSIDGALKEFQKRRVHIAVVTNHTSQILGVLTLEDIIEELVGDIDDEFDETEFKPNAK